MPYYNTPVKESDKKPSFVYLQVIVDILSQKLQSQLTVVQFF